MLDIINEELELLHEEEEAVQADLMIAYSIGDLYAMVELEEELECIRDDLRRVYNKIDSLYVL